MKREGPPSRFNGSLDRSAGRESTPIMRLLRGRVPVVGDVGRAGPRQDIIRPMKRAILGLYTVRRLPVFEKPICLPL